MVRLAVVRHDPPGTTTGPTFVLVHGLASNARLWDGVGMALADSGFASIAIDLRGHGQSPKVPVADGYGFAEVVGDVLELLDAEGLTGDRRPVIAGQSWGGNVVVDLAAQHPERARAVMAVDGGIIRLADRFPSWEECADRLAPPNLTGTPVTRMRAWMSSSHADWPPEGIEGALANFEVRADGTIAPWLNREAHLAILHGLWGHDPVARFRQLTLPAAILMADSGDAAWTNNKRAGVHACVEASPAAIEVEWLEGADHDLHAQHPRHTADSLIRLHERSASAESR